MKAAAPAALLALTLAILTPTAAVTVGTDATGTPVLETSGTLYYQDEHGLWVAVHPNGTVTYDAGPPHFPKGHRVFWTNGRITVLGVTGEPIEVRGTQPSVSEDWVAYVDENGHVRLLPLRTGGGTRPVDTGLRGEHPYALSLPTRPDVFLAFTREDDVVLTDVLPGRDAFYGLKPVGFTAFQVTRVTPEGTEPLGTWKPKAVPLDETTWLRTRHPTGPESWFGITVAGVPVKTTIGTLWLFPAPTAPVVDGRTGEVIGSSACTTSHVEVTAVAREDDGFLVLVCEGPSLKPVAERRFQGTDPVVGVPGPCDVGARLVAFKDTEGDVEVIHYDGHGFETATVGPGEPLALAAGVLFYLGPDGRVRCAVISTTHGLKVKPEEPETVKVNGGTMLKVGPVLFDPSTDTAYMATDLVTTPGGYLGLKAGSTYLDPLAYEPGEGLVPAARTEGSEVILVSDGRTLRVRVPTSPVLLTVDYVTEDGALHVLVEGPNPVLVSYEKGRVEIDPVLAIRPGTLVVLENDRVETLPAPLNVGTTGETSPPDATVYRKPGGGIAVLTSRDHVIVGDIAIVNADDGLILGAVAPDGREVIGELPGYRLENGRIVTPSGLRLDPHEYAIPVLPERWYVITDLELKNVPGTWELGTTPTLRAGTSLIEVYRDRNGKIAVKILTPFGDADAETNLKGTPLTAGWNGLLTVVYRADDGTVHAALLSPWPVIGVSTPEGVRILIAEGDGWKEGPVLPPSGSASRGYLPAEAISYRGTPYFVVDGYLLDREGHVVGYGDTLVTNGRRIELDEPLKPDHLVAVPAFPREIDALKGTPVFPPVVEVEDGRVVEPKPVWSERLPDGTIVALLNDRLVVVRDDLAYELPLGPGWTAELRGRELTLRKGLLTLTLYLDPWPAPEVTTVPTGRGAEVLALKNGGYVPVETVPTFPPTGVVPLPTGKGRIPALTANPTAVWTGTDVLPCRLEPPAAVWTEDDAVHVIPLTLTRVGAAVGPTLTVPGRLEGLGRTPGYTLVLTDRSALLLLDDGHVGEPVYTGRHGKDEILTVFHLDTGGYVAVLARVLPGTVVIEDVKRYGSVLPTPEGPIVTLGGKPYRLIVEDSEIEEEPLPTGGGYPGPKVVLTPVIPALPRRRYRGNAP